MSEEKNKTDEQEKVTPTEETTELKPDVKEEKDDKQKKKKSENDKYKKEVEKIKQEMDDMKDRLLRSAAEFDNYRRRTDKEKQGSVAFGVSNAVEKVLPILDTLEIAANAECKDEEYKKGVLLTVTLFKNSLTALGVEEIEAHGKEFNPEVHSAVAREKSEDYESGTVIRVLQKGYKIRDKIIRPAMVSVAE